MTLLMTLRAWSRSAAQAVIALAVLVLVAGPGLDRIVCAADGLGQVAHGQSAADSLYKPGAGHASDPADEDGTCVHGHCHAAGALDVLAPAPAATGVFAAVAFAAAVTTPPASAAALRLDRPPRA